MARILLADDDRAARDLLQRALAGDGHQVTTADDGLEADAILAKGGFDLLISDVQMPGLDGIALAGRSRTRAPRLAILLVSGHPDLLARASGLGIAGLATLAKPFALDKVRAEVRRLVGA